VNFPELHPALSSQAALSEAHRCLFCSDAPCTAACPTHIDVPRFIKKIASGNLLGSAETIIDANVLGLSCSRVCPVDVLCEGACVYHNLDKQPITIGLLQRHAMDHFYAAGGRLPQAAVETGKRVACVGAGPASLACAAELRRYGIAVTIFDKRELPGGLNTYGVAQYKFTPSDSAREVELIRSAGVEFRTGVEVAAADLEREYDALFIGIGLGATEPLGIPGEALPGIYTALDFIAAYKTAQTLPIGERVGVIGGGNTAIDAAVAARYLGAKRVAILYRRGEAQMSAFAFEYEHARQAGVEFVFSAQPKQFLGSDRVTGIDCGNLQFACDTAIVAIGQSRFEVPGIGEMVVQRETGQTANPKYFAGGDCVNGGREVVDAVAAGKRAARGIIQWLT
jgi:dihydropyrimidine dehydrogenase (NAD+) subunit PreT